MKLNLLNKEQLTDLYRTEMVFDFPKAELKPLRAMHRLMDRGQYDPLLITDDGEEPLGYAGVNTVLDEGYINNVAVAPQFRRQGVADELIAALVRFGRAKLAFLTLEVRASNAPAIALYAKHGFREAGRRKNYYDDPKEDAILMTLEFDHETESSEQRTTD